MKLKDNEKRGVILRILNESKILQADKFIQDNNWSFEKLNKKNIRIGNMYGVDVILRFN